MLEINNMRTGFWFVALSPFVSAVVASATAAAVSRRSRINSNDESARNPQYNPQAIREVERILKLNLASSR